MGKLFNSSAVLLAEEMFSMTDSEVIQIMWGNPELQSKFEIDPYGLSERELIILQLHEKFKFMSSRPDMKRPQGV